ncbi:tetratricopeptide repeat protein [candidate division WOR-3 bacterium]|nr:tetratricopeptide repeat protein [candidate division WOR-3 bacterium]
MQERKLGRGIGLLLVIIGALIVGGAVIGVIFWPQLFPKPEVRSMREALGLLEESTAHLQFYKKPLYNIEDTGLSTEVTLGIQAQEVNDHEAALEHFSKALSIVKYTDSKPTSEEGIDLSLLSLVGRSQVLRGNYHEARGTFEKMVAAAEALDDSYALAISLADLGFVYLKLKDTEAALRFSERSLSIAREHKYKQVEAYNLVVMGVIYYSLGEEERSLGLYEESLGISAKLRNLKGQTLILGNIGTYYREEGDFPKALDYHRQALELAEKTKDRRGQAEQLQHIGEDFQKLEDADQALYYFQEALDIFDERNDLYGIVETAYSVGYLSSLKGNDEKAYSMFKKALGAAEQLQDIELMGDLNSYTGNIALRLGKVDEAYEYFTRSLQVAQWTQDSKLEATNLFDLGRVYGDAGQFEDALEYLGEARALYEALGDTAAVKHVERSMGIVRSKMQ